MSQREATGLQQRFEDRAGDRRADCCDTGDVVEMEQAAEALQVQRKPRLVCAQAAHDRRTSAHGHHRDSMLTRDAQHLQHLIMTARTDDEVRSVIDDRGTAARIVDERRTTGRSKARRAGIAHVLAADGRVQRSDGGSGNAGRRQDPGVGMGSRPRGRAAHVHGEVFAHARWEVGSVGRAAPARQQLLSGGHGPSLAPRTRQTEPVPVPTPDLDAARRTRELEELLAGHVPDVLVIGGGITGCGVALDAASRGLDVALVESHDLAFGTSRWSSKLVHGGLRYLAHGDVAVAWESAVERSRLMTAIAPHLVRPLPHVMPFDTDPRKRVLVRSGLRAADLLRAAAGTPRSVLPRPRSISAGDARRLVPSLRASAITGATVHWDGQLVDDARLTVGVARTAAKYGTRIITRASAVDVTGAGARVRTTDGAEWDLHARHVIVAAGVWTQDLDHGTRLTTSRGSHVIVRPEALGHPRAALTVPVPGERGRYVFALPTLDGTVIAGITDDPVTGPIADVPLAPEGDVDWILAHVSAALDRPLHADDVIGTYAGLRPLVGDPGAESSADISRRHLVTRRPEGYVVVTGGKLTTYRRMAQDAVDALSATDARCRTQALPLVGAQPHGTSPPAGVPQRLVDRFGSEAARVAAYADDDASLLMPVAPGVPVLGVEIVHAVRTEGALDLDDVMERRTRLTSVPDRAEHSRSRVIEILEAAR